MFDEIYEESLFEFKNELQKIDYFVRVQLSSDDNPHYYGSFIRLHAAVQLFLCSVPNESLRKELKKISILGSKLEIYDDYDGFEALYFQLFKVIDDFLNSNQ